MKYIIPICIFLLLSSCYCFRRPTSYRVKRASKESKIALNKIKAETYKKLCKKYHLSMVGSGGSSLNGISQVGADFKIYAPQSKEALREIFVDCILELQSAINNCPEIRHDLIEYPFPIKCFKNFLLVFDESGNLVKYPNITVVHMLDNNIYYDYEDPENNHLDKKVEIESFDEALAILEKQGKSFSYPKELTDEEFKDEERHINHFFYEFAKPN